MADLNLSNNYIIISRDASSDSNDNMFSIFKIIDSINFNTAKEEATRFKAAYTKDSKTIMGVSVKYVACTAWSLPEKAEKDIPVKLEYSIIDPSGAVLSAQLQEAVFPKSNDVFRINMITEGFPYTIDGKYKILVKVLDSNSHVISEAFTSVRLSMNIQPSLGKA